MWLASVARASLEELRLDYEDFLRHRRLPLWTRGDPRREAIIARRPANANAVAQWARDQHEAQDGPRGQSEPYEAAAQSRASTGSSTPSSKSTYPEIAANGALALIAVACSLLDRQMAAQEKAFLEQGGFTERLYRARQAWRQRR